MRIWITRAEPGASRTAEKVRALGHEPVVAPLLEVHALPTAIDLDGVGALAFTSANGLHAFAERSAERALPVFTVGDATAAAARKAGFTDVTSAGGDLQALAGLIAAHAGRIAGAVLAPGPREPAGDLPAALAAKGKGKGVAARALPLYETRPRSPPEDMAGIDAALIHSPKAAERLATVMAGRPGPPVYCISPAAAAPLAGRPFARVQWGARPDEDSLLGLLPPP
ncbi:MAG TPA: uroporphyrinogen-III synthase [Caulobacteraceae bacterium]|jgi:uroporphyrinogen-III synthase